MTKFELSLPTGVSWKEDLLGFCYPFNFTTQKKKEKCGIFLGLTWTTIPPKPHSSKTISHLSDIQKQTQLFPNISWSLLNLNVLGEDFLGGVTGEETVGQWISTYVTKGASGAAVITLSPGPRGQT